MVHPTIAFEHAMNDTHSTSTAVGLVPPYFPTAEVLQSDSILAPSPREQYENRLYQLSRLHLDLYRLLIWPSENEGQNRGPGYSFDSGNLSSSTASVARIDETLAATETLIEILQHLFPVSPPVDLQTPNSDIADSPSSARRLSFDFMADLVAENPPSLSASSEVPAPSPDQRSDSATVLLILTCYLRLLHIYEPIVMSLHQSLQQPTSHGRSWRFSPSPLVSVSNAAQISHISLPAFSLGSFSLAASPDLNIGMLLHLVSHMLERIQGAVRVCFPSASSNRVFSVASAGTSGVKNLRTRSDGHRVEGTPAWLHSPMITVAEAALREVSGKEEGLMGMLQATKDILGI